MRFTPALFASRFRQSVGALVTHGKGWILSLNQVEHTDEKVRENVFEEGRKDRENLRLDAALRECVDAMERRYPEVTVDYDPGPGNIRVDGLFDVVCSNIVENGEGSVEVRVTDNRSGIEDHEFALVEDGTETPLKHGSGFWLALTA